MKNLTIIDHPLLRRDLTILRRKETPHGQFRETLAEAAAILAYEAMRDLQLEHHVIETPLEEAAGFEIAEEVIVVPILRAGLGMVNGFVRFVPEARIGHLGMYRDEKTKTPVDYYSKVPGGLESARIFVVDPMLATGGSSTDAITHLRKRGARRISFVCLVAAPEGVRALTEAHPEVSVFTATLDRELDELSGVFVKVGVVRHRRARACGRARGDLPDRRSPLSRL